MKQDILILDYASRENLKSVDDYLRLGLVSHEQCFVIVDWSHYQRFLESISPVDVNYIPTFDEYRGWKKSYSGWADGILDPGHCAWKEHYNGVGLPMNKYYEYVLEQSDADRNSKTPRQKGEGGNM